MTDEHTSSTEPIERRVARVVLVDEVGTVLLFSARDPAQPSGSEFWFTPGGGVEADETLEEGARREVYEETGALVEDMGPVVWQRTASFQFERQSYLQHESYFVLHCTRFEVRPSGWTDLEVRSTTGWRWWSVSDLETMREVVYPAGLGQLVTAWRRFGPGQSPAWIDEQ
jgi:8-oxo-dGTP pyrophosphatase MutT (NUDIX family)